MNKATIWLAPMDVMVKTYSPGFGDVVRANINRYTNAGSVEVADHIGQQAAEEVFDLTNNPCRQEERERVYGRGRSLSVGDLVEVGGTKWLCNSIGWTAI